MKKIFTQILVAIGFVVALVGVVLGVDDVTVGLAFSSVHFIGATLATAFVFAKNETVKNMGYVLCAVAGTYGIAAIIPVETDAEAVSTGLLIFAFGLIVMMVPAVIYAIIRCFSWCGFTIKSSKADACDIAAVLDRYKALEKEEILSAEEFEGLKNKVLKNSETSLSSIDDLKKWKKLLDQQVITEEEFSKLKAQAFQK